jgi:hypothetical protein
MKPSDQQSSFQNGNSILSRNELLEWRDLVLNGMRKMTKEEGFKSLVASGIYTADGKLTKEYSR